jgi:uncharacterized protein (TIGR02391 family)
MSVQSFPPTHIVEISSILTGPLGGLTHKEITQFLALNGISEGQGTNKIDRLSSALVGRQQKDGCGNNVAAFIQHVVDPARYTRCGEQFELIRERVNTVLLFSGLMLGENGKLQKAVAATTLSESDGRVNQLKQKLSARNVHVDVINCCRKELLTDKNYFHTVLEASKSVAAKIRSKSGLTADGSTLVDAALAAGKRGYPLLALNKHVTETEQNEQNGFANLVRGMFSMFRNPTAHQPKVERQVSEDEALDFLVFASLLHRKLDKTTCTNFSPSP